MKRFAIISVLSFFCCTLWAQESHIHRNIGLDSLMTLMQQNCRGQVYYVKDAGASNLVFTIDLGGNNPADKIKEAVKRKGYSISEYNNDLYILKGLALQAALPDNYFKLEGVQKEEKRDEKTIEYTNILSKNIQEATGGSKVYQIGDKGDGQTEERVYLSGYIRSYMTGEPVVGVTLLDNKSKAFAQSDAHGFYRILIPTGRVALDVIGFSLEDTKINLQVYSNGSLDITVKEKVFALNEVIVSSEEVNKVKNTSLGLETIRVKALKKVPVVLGEADVVKVLLTLPGVKQVGEASNGFNVRGGAVDQNLVLFNGGTIYNPSHLFGLFSGFNPDLINDVELYKCSIPVEYGGRISSVLDVNSRQGNNKNLTGSVSAGLLTTKAHIEGPIGEKTTFIAGTRVTYSDWLLKMLPEEKSKGSDYSMGGIYYNPATDRQSKNDYRNGAASFFDFTAGINHHFNENNSLHLNGYISSDKFKFKLNTQYGYDNMNGSLKWRSIFNKRNSMEIIAGYDNYNYMMSDFTVATSGYDMKFEIGQLFGKIKFKSTVNDAHTLTYGANYINYDLMPGSYMPHSNESLVIGKQLESETGMEGALYIGDSWSISDKLSVDYGTRVSMFNSGKSYFNPEIKLSGRYLLSDNWSLKAGFNSMTQYIHMLSNTVSVSPTDTWKLSDKDIKPQTGWQIAAGAYTTTKQHSIDISIEAYYKRMKNYLDFKSGAILLMNPNVAEDVVTTQGKAYGIEIMASKSLGKLNGWASYSWSRTKLREIGDRGASAINKGRWYNAAYDKPHEFKVAGNYKFTHRVHLSVNLDYATGRPATVPAARYFYNNGYRLYYTERNSYRVPDYFRVDMALNIEPTHRIKAFTHFSFTVGVYNINGRKNTYSIYYEGTSSNVKGYQLCVFGSPIPYINFNFKF